MPTVVDTDIFKPVADKPTSDEPVLGWIGTHSTFPYLQSRFFPCFLLWFSDKFRLKNVGASQDVVEVPGVTVESLPWRLDREVADFQSVDIGLYPIDSRCRTGNLASLPEKSADERGTNGPVASAKQ